MSKHKSNASRLSKQNYCTFCEYRVKVEGGTWCVRGSINDAKRVSESMKTCELLRPFDVYKSERGKV